MQIDVWLKIRDRSNLDFVLKHLSFWLSTYSDTSKYKIHLYNENLNLPPEYAIYNPINKNKLLDNQDCKRVFDLINSSRISNRWKPAAFALVAPYYYLNNSSYIINIDADDIISLGDISQYSDKIIEIMEREGLPTLSYDYIFSNNLFEHDKNRMPHHWTFGFNFSKQNTMKIILDKILNNVQHYASYIKGINMNIEVNIDILLSSFLLNEGKHYKYFCFITKEGFYHRGFNNFEVYSCKYLDGFNVFFQNKTAIHPLHYKSILVE